MTGNVNRQYDRVLNATCRDPADVVRDHGCGAFVLVSRTPVDPKGNVLGAARATQAPVESVGQLHFDHTDQRVTIGVEPNAVQLFVSGVSVESEDRTDHFGYIDLAPIDRGCFQL